MRPSAIVIGAGIAGLAAADRLVARGFTVTVFEAQPRVGGRMSTDVLEGCRMDRGAQFLSTGYPAILSLIDRCGLSGELGTPTPWAGVVRSGQVRRIHAGRPWTVARSGLLRWRDLARLLLPAAVDVVRARKASLGDYADWQAWDDEDAAHWITRRFGHEALEYVFEPMLEGLYFQAPEGSSRTLPLWMWSFGARRHRIVALRHGMGSLTSALAQRLDVRLSTPVTALHEDADGVRVETPAGSARADCAVLATTASIARRLDPGADAPAQALLATDYSTTLNLGLVLAQGIAGSRIPEDVYGVLIPRQERRVIAAISVESRKSPDLVAQGELLNVMLDGRAGVRLIDAEDSAVLAAVLPELERYVPGVRAQLAHAQVCRWREAEPRSPVGRAHAVGAYRAALPSRPRILLAGDYTSTPTTEGAAQSGLWAAERLTVAYQGR